jgi:hypothetical protein
VFLKRRERRKREGFQKGEVKELWGKQNGRREMGLGVRG